MKRRKNHIDSFFFNPISKRKLNRVQTQKISEPQQLKKKNRQFIEKTMLMRKKTHKKRKNQMLSVSE